jgi:hypothetical protein
MAQTSALNKEIKSFKAIGNKLLIDYQMGKIHQWQDLVDSYGLDLPDEYRTTELSFASLLQFISVFSSADQRAEKAIQQVSGKRSRSLTRRKLTRKYVYDGVLFMPNRLPIKKKISLAPEQAEAVELMLSDTLVDQKVSTTVQGVTGAGKTYVMLAYIAELIKLGWHKEWLSAFPNPYMIITRKPVVKAWERVRDMMGIPAQYLHVTHYQALTVGFLKQWITLKREVDIYNEASDTLETKTEVVINPVAKPAMIILDESQSTNRDSQQTRLCNQLADTDALRRGQPRDRPYVIRTSATPFITINDMKGFCLSIPGLKSPTGIRLTEQNWASFAACFASDPSKANASAMRSISKYLDDYIVHIRRVPWKAKAYTQIRMCDFPNEQWKAYYMKAQDEYVKLMAKLGKNTNYGQMEKLVARMNFAHAGEGCRVQAMVDLAIENLYHKRQTIIATRFKDTIVAAQLALEERGIFRKNVSILWGGVERLRPELELSEGEFDELQQVIMAGERPLTREELRRMDMSVLLKQDRIRNQDDFDPEAQLKRIARMKELRMDKVQDEYERQGEIYAYQMGETRICLMTGDTGGVGISLDHCSNERWPGSTILAPIDSGHKFAQIIGRDYRRYTISDVLRYVMLMKGTIEEVIAEGLDQKLKSISAFTRGASRFTDIMEGVSEAYESKQFSEFKNPDMHVQEVDNDVDPESDEALGITSTEEAEDDDE